MKKTLLLLASMLMSAVSFAQGWQQPVPKFVPMVDDGKTAQYLYNVEAGGFFIGANDWGTRASISYSDGAKVKMTMIYEDPENPTPETALGTWAIVDSVAKFSEYRKTFAGGAQDIWVDNNNGANADGWIVKSLGENKYAISNPAAAPGVLTMFKKLDGAENTRLWLFDETDKDTWEDEQENPRYEGVCSTWAFVSEDEYAEILPKMAQYASAVALGEAIASAKSSCNGIDVANAEAIYNNLNSTVAELDSAKNILVPAAIVEFQKNQASADKPADFTDLVPSANFEGSYDGWTTTTGAQNKGLATNRCDNGQYPGTTMTGQFWENWNPDQFKGKMYTRITDLPAGVYKLEIDAFVNGGSDSYVYLNGYKTNQGGKTTDERTVTLGCGNDIPARFSVMGYINDGDTLEIGLDVQTVSANWTGLDNAKLTYYGAGLDAYKLWYQQERTSIISTMNALVGPETKYDKSQRATFEQALATGDAATTKEALVEAVTTLKAAADATVASIDAYAQLIAKVEEYQEDETEYNEEAVMGYFSDFVNADDVEGGEEAVEELKRVLEQYDKQMPVEVSPIQILEECTYSTEYVLAYIPALKELHDICASLSLDPGTDITTMLADPKFTDPNGKGWTKEKGAITWRGGFYAFPVAESYHSAFDFYQEVTVPNGIYSLSLNGFCRPDDGETDPAAEIYMNDYATKFQTLAGGALKDEPVDGFNCYLSQGTSGAYHSNPIFAENDAHSSPADNLDRDNGDGYVPDGMEGASIAFSANRYQAKVYGMVENGKIKLGARCSSTHQWVLWGNFVLKYEGESDEAMMALAESFVGPAQQYLDDNSENMSTPSVEALEAAIAAVNNGQTAAEIKEGIKTMNAALEDAKANVVAVEAFAAAKDAMDAAANEAEKPSAAAVATYEELSSVEYTDLTTAQINEYVQKFNECASTLRVPADVVASDEEPADMTKAIVNPSFDEIGIFTGWDAEGSSSFGAGGTTSTCAERFEMTFNTFQDIYGLPEGTYGVKVQGFYRYGSAEDDYNCVMEEKTPEIGAFLYAEATGCKASAALPLISTAAVASGFGGSTVTVGGSMVVPNSMEAANYWFEAGNYQVEEIFVKVAADGKLRIGVNKDAKISADWVIVDNFELWYYGNESSKTVSDDPSAIKDAQTTAAPAGIYSISGAKLNSLKQGINIVKGADGSVRKIFVK